MSNRLNYLEALKLNTFAVIKLINVFQNKNLGKILEGGNKFNICLQYFVACLFRPLLEQKNKASFFFSFLDID